MARALLEAGADRNGAENGTSPVVTAAIAGDHETIRVLTTGIDPSNLRGLAEALYFAAQRNATEIVTLLLELGADPESHHDPYKGTPLIIAAGNGHLESARLLLDAGAEVDAPAEQGATALGVAINNNYGDIVRLLVETGANVNRRGPDGTTPAMRARSPEVLRTLVEAGADPNARDDEGRTALLRIPFYPGGQGYSGSRYRKPPTPNPLGAVQFLLSAGVDVNAEDQDGKTVLDRAVAEGHDEIASALRAAGGRESTP